MDARAHAHLDFAVRSREAPDAAGPPPRRRWTPSPFPAPPSPPPVRTHARGSAGRRRSATGDGWSGAANREQAPHGGGGGMRAAARTRAPTNRALRSEEQTSELQALMRTSNAVFWLKNKTTHNRLQLADICCK